MHKAGFDDRLKTALLESGWTQIRLAARLDITQATVSRWLSGKFMPSPKTIPILAETLGVETQWLVNGDGHKQRIYANNLASVNTESGKKRTWKDSALASYQPPEESPEAQAHLEQARHYLSLFMPELSERQIIVKINEVLLDTKMPLTHRIVVCQELLGELARRNGFRVAGPSLESEL